MPPPQESAESVLSLAFSWPVVRRALGYAVIVGLILTAINHGNCVISGHFSWSDCGIKTVLTACIPYAVSTLSSVQAIRNSGSR